MSHLNRRSLLATAPLAISAVALAGCKSGEVSAAVTTIAAGVQTILADAAKALNFYGVAKGIAEVAVASVPALSAVLTPVIVLADAIVPKLQAGIATLQADVAADATAVQALIASLTAQATTLTVQAAPVIKVVSNGLTTAPAASPT